MFEFIYQELVIFNGEIMSLDTQANFQVKTSPVETIVNSQNIDWIQARTIVEEKKLSFFTTFGFIKPKPEEVVYDTFALGYEVFVRIKGNYHIDYYRKILHKVTVDKQVKEIIILGQTLTPIEVKAEKRARDLISGERESNMELHLDSEERIMKDVLAEVVYDDSGNEVNQPSILKGENNPAGEKILKSAMNVEPLGSSIEAFVEKFKPKIYQRPGDVDRVVEEILDITQISVIYSPCYHVKLLNTRSKEIKQFRIDGLSGEISPITASRWETLCPQCSNKITLDEKFCKECGTKLLP